MTHLAITVENIYNAILNPSIKTFAGVELPSPQTAGTTTQIRSYAKMKARKIYEQIKD